MIINNRKKIMFISSLIKIAATIVSFGRFVQSCTQDILEDDMRTPRPYTNGTGFNGGPTEQNLTLGVSFNLVDADYGEAGVPYVYTNGSMTLTIDTISSVYTPNLTINPYTADTFNYWYTKFDTKACFNATQYSGVEIVGTFPSGLNFNITFTQKANDCVARAIDSQYRLLTSYITPNGQAGQVLYVPFSDFATNLVGQPYDFTHLKDFTLVNMTPRGAVVTFNRITVKGTCTSNSTTSQPTLPYGATSTPKADSNSAAVPLDINSKLGIIMMALCIIFPVVI